MVDENIESPFQPGIPVNPEYFKGRNEIIMDVHRYIPSAINGNAQHFFITGKRGMGKTSVANYIVDYYERTSNTIGIHVYNDGTHDIDSLITVIVEKLLNKNQVENWVQKLKKGFKDNIEEIGFMDAKLKFRPTNDVLNILKDNFADFLNDLCKTSKKHVIIVIDDIDGLSENKHFANWYKSLADTLATNDYMGHSNITFILAGYPEKLTNLYHQNESFQRIFHHETVHELSYNEIKSFFMDIFKKNNISYDEKALELMIYYCSGMPTVMQEIGDATFFYSLNNNRHINSEIVTQGLMEAGRRIGIKYLQPVLDKRIRSEYYPSMFNKISMYTFEGNPSFTKRNLESLFTQEENNVFPDFLKRAKELRIIELSSSKKKGEYQFTNKLYPLYFLMTQIKETQQTTLD